MAATAPGGAEVTAALVGRPNSGKTSLLVRLTGVAQRPVNFPGTSVERVEGLVAVGNKQLRVVDLPGISSVRALSKDEEVTLGYLRGQENGQKNQRPDVLCVVLDATKLSVELHLLKQVSAIDLPIVVALNKQDLARRHGRAVDAEHLAAALGLPVVETRASKGDGVEDLRQQLLQHAGAARSSELAFDPDLLALEVQARPTKERSWTDRLDRVLLHPVFGGVALVLIILATFQLVFTVAEPFMGLVETAQDWFAGVIESAVPAGAVRSFLVDGIVNGVGSVIVFVPQIALLIAFVGLLEGSGYMARAAFILDRPLGKVGLSGRSFLPLTSSFACAIPGILATRIIDNERDRIATIVVSPLMSCSARMPVYVVLIGAFFPLAWAGVVLLGLYGLGVIIAVIVALVLRRTVLKGGSSLLAMELPIYQRPSLRLVGSQVYAAVREFLVLAGTVILATTIVIWVLSYYPRPDSIKGSFDSQRQEIERTVENPATRAIQLERVDAAESGAYFEQSLLARFGKFIQPVFAPAGFDWRTTVGILAAFPAREIIIPAMGTLYSLGDVDAGEHTLASLNAEDAPKDGLREKLRTARHPDGRPVFSALVALALMAFFALCSQCMATLGAIRRETRSWGWPVFTFVYMTVLAWLVAVAIYQVGTWLGYGGSN